MTTAVLADAARVKPPHTSNNNEAALGAGVASAALDLFAGQGDDVMHLWISVTCTQNYNIMVGNSAVAAPTNKEFFGATVIHQFRAIRSKLGSLRVIMPVAGDYKWWISGP